MEEQSVEASRIEALVLQLEPTSPDARAQIALLRAQMDAACDRKEMTLHEWRRLVDLITSVRAQCEGASDPRGNNGTGFGQTGSVHGYGSS